MDFCGKERLAFVFIDHAVNGLNADNLAGWRYKGRAPGFHPYEGTSSSVRGKS